MLSSTSGDGSSLSIKRTVHIFFINWDVGGTIPLRPPLTQIYLQTKNYKIHVHRRPMGLGSQFTMICLLRARRHRTTPRRHCLSRMASFLAAITSSEKLTTTLQFFGISSIKETSPSGSKRSILRTRRWRSPTNTLQRTRVGNASYSSSAYLSGGPQ